MCFAPKLCQMTAILGIKIWFSLLFSVCQTRWSFRFPLLSGTQKFFFFNRSRGIILHNFGAKSIHHPSFQTCQNVIFSTQVCSTCDICQRKNNKFDLPTTTVNGRITIPLVNWCQYLSNTPLHYCVKILKFHFKLFLAHIGLKHHLNRSSSFHGHYFSCSHFL